MHPIAKTAHPKRRIEALWPARSIASIWSGLACACLIGGISAPLLGLALIIIHTILVNDNLFNQIGTGLMIISIPLLLMGSHFLDVSDDCRRAAEQSENRKCIRGEKVF